MVASSGACPRKSASPPVPHEDHHEVVHFGAVEFVADDVREPRGGLCHAPFEFAEVVAEPGVVGPLLHDLLHHAGRERLVEVERAVVRVRLEEVCVPASRMGYLPPLPVEPQIMVYRLFYVLRQRPELVPP